MNELRTIDLTPTTNGFRGILRVLKDIKKPNDEVLEGIAEIEAYLAALEEEK